MSAIRPPVSLSSYMPREKRLFLETPRTNWRGVVIAVLVGVLIAEGAILVDREGWGVQVVRRK